MTPRKPSLLSRLVMRVLLALYRRRGWQLEGSRPACEKFVITGAPHTSNWDFVFFLGVADAVGIAPSFMGKHTLFRWPFGRFMRDMGGISVDRSKRANSVDQVVAAFDRADAMALVVAPEGSRGSSGEWRSGFYQIALKAGVPIVPAWVDHANRRGGMGEAIIPSGDYRADLLKIAEFYRAKRPDCGRFERLVQSLREDDKQGEGPA
ncbi:lysophospholipid acyltransferase family protein [Qipengyuania sp. SM2507]